jgi:ABC-type Mn2+/Zn2+ transport system permease subunit
VTSFFPFFNPEFPFIRNAFCAGLLPSVLFGVTGSPVTARRGASLAGAVSLTALGGIGWRYSCPPQT